MPKTNLLRYWLSEIVLPTTESNTLTKSLSRRENTLSSPTLISAGALSKDTSITPGTTNTITNTEKIEEKITYGIEEAKQIGIDKASEKIEQKLPNKENILQKYENSYAGEDYVDVEVTYEVLENIGTKEKIVF